MRNVTLTQIILFSILFYSQAERLMREDSCGESDSSHDFDADYPESGYESFENNFENNNNVEAQEGPSVTTKDYIRVLMSEQLVCLTYLRFVALFCQTCLESSVPPIMQKYFDYGDQENVAMKTISYE